MDIPFIDGRVAHNRRYQIGTDDRPLVWIEPGGTVHIYTLDASGNQITQRTASPEELDPYTIFPVTGPIGIEGVVAGDAVGVEIVSVELAETGHIWTRPGLGFGPAPSFLVREVDVARLSLMVGDKTFRLPPRVMVGTIAVAPNSRWQARDLGAHGGNLDTVQAAPGAFLWLQAQCPGGLVYAGDVHAAMGDAEICGTGVETAAALGLRLHATSDWAPPCPVIVNGNRVWIIGIGKTLNEALENGLTHVIQMLRQNVGLTASDAYLTAAAALEAQICQVVNPHASIALSLTSGMDRSLIPAHIFHFGGSK